MTMRTDSLVIILVQGKQILIISMIWVRFLCCKDIPTYLDIFYILAGMRRYTLQTERFRGGSTPPLLPILLLIFYQNWAYFSVKICLLVFVNVQHNNAILYQIGCIKTTPSKHASNIFFWFIQMHYTKFLRKIKIS